MKKNTSIPTTYVSPLYLLFPTEESAQLYLESRMWPRGTICPECKSGKRITSRKDRYYRCNACKFDFTVRTGTIFERSHIPLHKWIYGIHQLIIARKSLPPMQLAKEINITQKSARFMLQRFKEACFASTNPGKLRGVIDVDRVFTQ